MNEIERQIEEGDVAYLAGPHEPWCNFVTHDGFSCDCGVSQRKQDIAAALAEERAKARAPFLRLASEFGSWPSARILSPHDAGDRIRQAAKEIE